MIARPITLAASLLSLVAEVNIATHAAEPRSVAGRTLLFVDDHDVLYRAGTKRILHPFQPNASNPVIADGKPWEMAIAWTSIYRDPRSGKYQLWYQAHSGKRAQKKSHETVVCYAESTDGVHFVKPDLGIHEYNDIAQTNIVLVGNGGYGDRYCCSVIVDNRDPDASRRYKMAYYDWSVVDGQE